jgi:hypothetical protein
MIGEEQNLCRKDKRIEFEKPKIVVSEGIEEERFFPRLLRICNKPSLSETIQFVNCKGKSKLENFLKGARDFTGFNQITSIGIVLDANGQPQGIQSSLQKAQNALSLIQFPVPAQLGMPEASSGKRAIIWIMPNNQDAGELEDLCLEALSKHILMPCVDQTESCVNGLTQRPTKSAKSRLYTLLAWLDRPGRGLAELSDNEIQSWDLKVFEPLINTFFSQL